MEENTSFLCLHIEDGVFFDFCVKTANGVKVIDTPVKGVTPVSAFTPVPLLNTPVNCSFTPIQAVDTPVNDFTPVAPRHTPAANLCIPVEKSIHFNCSSHL